MGNTKHILINNIGFETTGLFSFFVDTDAQLLKGSIPQLCKDISFILK